MKFKIKSACIAFSKKRSNTNKSHRHHLITALYAAEEKLARNPDQEKLQRQTQNLKKDIELKELSIARGAQIRSRVRWIEEGEKTKTKYFLNSEKQKGSNNTISSLKINQQSTGDPSEILQEIRWFYTNMYKKDTLTEENRNIKNRYLAGETYPTLSEEEKQRCEKVITENELTEALNKLNTNSAPGSDGITPTCYQQFWEKIETSLP